MINKIEPRAIDKVIELFQSNRYTVNSLATALNYSVSFSYNLLLKLKRKGIIRIHSPKKNKNPTVYELNNIDTLLVTSIKKKIIIIDTPEHTDLHKGFFGRLEQKDIERLQTACNEPLTPCIIKTSER